MQNLVILWYWDQIITEGFTLKQHFNFIAGKGGNKLSYATLSVFQNVLYKLIFSCPVKSFTSFPQMTLKWWHVLICICGISLWGFACQNLCWALCGSDRNYVYKAKTSQLIYIFHLHLHANWLLWNNLSEQEQRTCRNNKDYFKVTTFHLKMIGALHHFSIVLSTLKQLAQFLGVPDFSFIYFLFFSPTLFHRSASGEP